MISTLQDHVESLDASKWRCLHVFDLDHTLLTGNSSAFFFRFLNDHGCFSLSDRLRVMAYGIGYWANVLSMETIHRKVFHHFYVGKPASLFSCYLEEFLQEHIPPLCSPVLLTHLKKLQKEPGTLVAIFSASPEMLVEPIARLLGFHIWAGTRYPFCSVLGEMVYDSEGRIQVLSGECKAMMLEQLAKRYEIPMESTVAYSDHIDDLPFLEKAGTAVAVAPSFRLARIARARGWQIFSHHQPK